VGMERGGRAAATRILDFKRILKGSPMSQTRESFSPVVLLNRDSSSQSAEMEREGHDMPT